ncbi:MAG: cobalt transporter CbiM [Motiliproteus sp.]
MAHIPDGVLSAPVLIGGALATLAAVSYATRRLDYDRIPQAAVLAAAFFVASLASVPVGASSVHLILNGLMGILLGWTAVPAILMALLMQAVFFGYGGLMVLGVNTFNIALPALICGLLLAPRLQTAQGKQVFMLGAMAGAIGVALTGLLVCASLILSGPEYLPAGKVILLTYLPLMLAEAAVTGATLSFIVRVAPELLREAR